MNPELSDDAARIIADLGRVFLCPSIPQGTTLWTTPDGTCPHCHRPVAEHEEFQRINLKSPEPAAPTRWQGFKPHELAAIHHGLRLLAKDPREAELVTPLADEAWLAFCNTRPNTGTGPPHLRDDAPYRVCEKCGRRSWGSEFGERCGMVQPDRMLCSGTFGIQWVDKESQE